MGVERLQALAAILEHAITDIDAIVAQANPSAARVTQNPTDNLVVYGAGVLLHGFYTELEKIFQRVARDMEGFSPRGDAWHMELLAEMAIDIPGIRPALITSKIQERLIDYLRFRHLFRNLYVLNFKPEEIARRLHELPPLWSEVHAALFAFIRAIRHIASIA